MRHGSHHRRALGFTLTEMAIVLAVVGVLAAGIWNLMTGANTQVRDEAAANQQEQLIAAVKAFLADSSGQQYMAKNIIPAANGGCASAPCAPSTSYAIPLPVPGAGCTFAPTDPNLAGFCNFLPPGFTSATTNSYLQLYNIRFLRDATPNPAAAPVPPTTYSFMILTSGPGADIITDTSGARISSLIGGDGGFIYSAPVCTPGVDPTTACGSFGGWTAAVTGAVSPGYGFAAPATGGFVASRTYISPEQNVFDDWLARIKMPGDTIAHYNTMTVPEYLGGNALVMGGFNGAAGGTPPAAALPTGGSIYMGAFGLTTTAGNINMQAGSLNMNLAGTTSGGGSINFQGGTLVGVANIDVGGVTLAIPDPSVSLTSGITMSGNMVGLSAVPPYLTPNPVLTVIGTCTKTDPTNNPTGIPPSKTVDALGNSQCQDTIDVTGDVTVLGLLQSYNLFAGTFIYKASDIRLKSNIEPIVNPLMDIMKLKPVTFNYKSTGKASLGVIAQDLEKVYPQLVTTNGGTKYVDYEGLVGPLIGAVQELKKENDKLRQDIDIQKEREKMLERKLTNDQ